jgi:hypothetical protein
VQAGDEPPGAAKQLKHRATDPRHHQHAQRDIGRVGDLDADLRDLRTKRTHRKRHDIHHTPAHRAGKETAQRPAHLDRITPMIGRPGVDLALRANERAVLDTSNITRI